MAMTWEKFEALVQRLETDAREAPRAYKVRVFLLALLGYVYIFGILALLLALVAFLVLILVRFHRAGYAIGKFALALIGLIFIVARSLWVRLPPPDGLALTRRAAGPLFDVADELRRALRAPTVHRILLTDDFNAGVAQVPRLGIFGWPRNYLLVGLPLLQALSPEEFRAVLAHEFGHLSGAHGRFGAWVYRLRQTWAQLLERLERQEHWGTVLFSAFFQRYAPFFMAYTFVLARAQEYEADRSAVELAGARHLADALIRLKVNGALLAEEFWPRLYKRANDQSQPPAAPYGEMARSFVAGTGAEPARRWLDRAMATKTSSEDTHPSLTDRLAALGQEARLPAPAAEAAAARFLGDSLPDLSERLSAAWQQRVTASWRERYEQAQDAKRRLRDLDEKAAREPLTPDEAFQRASLTEDFGDAEAAGSLYRRVLELDAGHAGASFALGRILLAQGNEEGIRLIETAMDRDAGAILPGCQVIHEFLTERGREEDARVYRERARRQAEVLEEAHAERATLGFKETYLPHGLPTGEVEAIRAKLAHFPHVAAAYLVRKQVRHFPEKPVYALGIVIRPPWYRHRSAKTDATLAHQIAGAIEHPEVFYVVPLNDRNGKLKKIMRAVPEAQIYRR